MRPGRRQQDVEQVLLARIVRREQRREQGAAPDKHQQHQRAAHADAQRFMHVRRRGLSTSTSASTAMLIASTTTQ